MLKRYTGSSGFTLLEIVISLGLIATVLLAVFQLQAQNLNLLLEAQFITVANELARERLARIQAGGTLIEGTETGDFGEDYPDYSYTQEISAESDLDNIYRIRLSILLEEETPARNLSLEAYLFRSEK
ncbi:MAG: type IV pilus modification PilV family protein [Desulfatiglandales bacterium]